MLPKTYLKFVLLPNPAHIKTSKWSCRAISDDTELGIVVWFGSWRQYCYFPADTIYSAGCLKDIAEFLDKTNQEYRNKRRTIKEAILK